MNYCPKLVAKLSLAFLLFAQFYGIFLLVPPSLDSANLQSVSDTLSNSRLSFRGQLNGAVAVNSGVIVLDTTSPLSDNKNTSTGSGALVEGDSIRVGGASNASVVTIKTIESATRVITSTGISVAASTATPVIASSSAVHTVVFTPVSQIPNGIFRVLIPASATQTNSGDGLPDKDGFDWNDNNDPTVSCSGGGSGFSWGLTAATVSATIVGGNNYHSFECQYGGTGAPSTAITMTIGTAAGNKLINPSPANTTRNPGQADAYTFRVRHLEGSAGSFASVDETTGQIGLIEAVRVTATVAPTISFTLTGVASGQSICGQTTDVTTTVNTVPLGTLTTSSFSDGAQLLSVSTNAAGGYSLTASESAALTAWDVAGAPTISDTACGGSCTVTAAADWSTTSQKGFGYSLQDVAGDSVTATLEYDNGGATFKARPFGVTAQQIMSSSSPVDTDQAYVCYRAIVSGTQQAGDYENYVIYIATATF